LLKGTQFFEFMSPELPDAAIKSLPRAFGAVAADLETGQEGSPARGARAGTRSEAPPGKDPNPHRSEKCFTFPDLHHG
jgi:hypothetical protein